MPPTPPAEKTRPTAAETTDCSPPEGSRVAPESTSAAMIPEEAEKMQDHGSGQPIHEAQSVLESLASTPTEEARTANHELCAPTPPPTKALSAGHRPRTALSTGRLRKGSQIRVRISCLRKWLLTEDGTQGNEAPDATEEGRPSQETGCDPTNQQLTQQDEPAQHETRGPVESTNERSEACRKQRPSYSPYPPQSKRLLHPSDQGDAQMIYVQPTKARQGEAGESQRMVCQEYAHPKKAKYCSCAN